MRIDNNTVEFVFENDIKFEEDMLRLKNKKIETVVAKSLDYLKNELKKDYIPKEREDDSSLMEIKGLGDIKNDEDRIVFIFEKAIKGCAEAQHMIAHIYYDGKRFEAENREIVFGQDRTLSGLWEFLAAMNGHAYAQYNFAYCASFSFGKYDMVRFPFEDGLKLMEMAANQDYTNAEFIVTEIFLNIKGRPEYKKYINIQKGIRHAERLNARGFHDFDEYIEKYRSTGTI